MRTRASRYRDNNENLTSENQRLTDAVQLGRSASRQITTLESRLAEVEKERNKLKDYERRSVGLSIEFEEYKRRVQMGGVGSGAVGEGSEAGLEKQQSQDDVMLKEELRREFYTLSLIHI